MEFEKNIFKRCKVNFDKLLNFGFVKKKDNYLYIKKFHDNEFEIIINVKKDGKVSSKVIDLEMDDEYVSVKIETQNGAFVSLIRDEYINILKEIKENCFDKDYFLMNQANRITSYIKEKYQDEPEFLWDKLPGCGVFRNKKNNKWYSIIMNINKKKFNGEEKEIEIMNVKLEKEKVESLITKSGYAKAYHMNKKDWITIFLDDTLSDSEIISLVDESWNIINEKNFWLIPANPKYYDVVNMFNDTDTIIWKQSSDILVGDIIFLYVASPYSCILFKCLAIDVKIPYEYSDENVKMRYVVKLKLLKRFKDGEISFERLNNLGIKMIRGPRKIDKTLVEKLEK